jgi:hypothetical protein
LILQAVEQRGANHLDTPSEGLTTNQRPITATGTTPNQPVNIVRVIIRPERWCQTLNPVVCYASKIVVSPDELTIADAIILHSLGSVGA